MNSVGILKSTDDLESLWERKEELDDIEDDCGNSASSKCSDLIKSNLSKIFQNHYRSY